MKLQLLFALGISLVLPTFVAAEEKEDVCVKFEKDMGWSKGYAVQGTVIDGYDLNLAVESIGRFKTLTTYVVIFWDQDQASILELPPYHHYAPILRELVVKDQEGRRWKIKEGHFQCN